MYHISSRKTSAPPRLTASLMLRPVTLKPAKKGAASKTDPKYSRLLVIADTIATFFLVVDTDKYNGFERSNRGGKMMYEGGADSSIYDIASGKPTRSDFVQCVG